MKHLDSCSKIGNWVLENITPMMPILLLLDTDQDADGNSATLRAVSGSDYWKESRTVLGFYAGTVRAQSHVFIPTASTVTLNVSQLKNVRIHAFQ